MALPASDTFLQTTGSQQALTVYSASWSVGQGTFTVPSGLGYAHPSSGGVDNFAFWNADTFNADQESTITTAIGWAASGLYIGPAARCSAGNAYAIQANATEWYLARVVGGAWTQVATGTRTFGNADLLRLRVSGTGASVTVLFEHATAAAPTVFNTVTTYNDTAGNRILSGAAGISGYDNSSSPAIDFWSADNLAAGPVNYVLTADQGSYSISGQAANLFSARTLLAAQGTYSLAGQAANLVYSAGGTNYSLVADFGTYNITGSASFSDIAMSASPGTYNISGSDATLSYLPATGANNYTLIADNGNYSVAGQPVNLFSARKLAAAFGEYATTGLAAGLYWSGAPVVQGGDLRRRLGIKMSMGI